MSAPTKINRKTVRRFIKQYGGVPGTFEQCTRFVHDELTGGHPAGRTKVEELIDQLMRADALIHDRGVLRITTAEERTALQEARYEEITTRRAIRRRTSAKRGGGIRSAGRPVSGAMAADLDYGAWAARRLGQPEPVTV